MIAFLRTSRNRFPRLIALFSKPPCRPTFSGNPDRGKVRFSPFSSPSHGRCASPSLRFRGQPLPCRPRRVRPMHAALPKAGRRNKSTAASRKHDEQDVQDVQDGSLLRARRSRRSGALPVAPVAPDAASTVALPRWLCRPRSGRPTAEPLAKAGRAVIHRLRSRPAQKAARRPDRQKRWQPPPHPRSGRPTHQAARKAGRAVSQTAPAICRLKRQSADAPAATTLEGGRIMLNLGMSVSESRGRAYLIFRP